MWILARLIILVGGFYLRYINFFRKRFEFTKTLPSNIAYAVYEFKHKGKVTEFVWPCN